MSFKQALASFFLITGMLLSTACPTVWSQGNSILEDTSSKPLKKLAIVIDDFGNSMEGSEEMLDLPVKLTVAVMPFLPTSKQDAELAHAKGHEVFIHMPMEPIRGKKSWLGPGAITTDLSDEEIRRRVEEAIAEVPYAVGMNNHMGSKATADERVMRIVLQVCKERGLIFLDSRTSDKSVISKLSRELGVRHVDNQLFLDEVYTVRHIAKQMRKLTKLLDHRDVCIAIGHVGPPGKKTAEVIRSSLPVLKQRAEFVTISGLLAGSNE